MKSRSLLNLQKMLGFSVVVFVLLGCFFNASCRAKDEGGTLVSVRFSGVGGAKFSIDSNYGYQIEKHGRIAQSGWYLIASTNPSSPFEEIYLFVDWENYQCVSFVTSRNPIKFKILFPYPGKELLFSSSGSGDDVEVLYRD